MQIHSLDIAVSDPDELRPFYTDTLGLPLRRSNDESFTVVAGATELTVSASDAATSADTNTHTETFYHVAFNVSAPIERVMEWLHRQSIDILEHEGDEYVYSEFLDSDLVYFSDAAGNVLEFISRRDSRDTPFDAARIDELCEIGFPVEDPRAQARSLADVLGIDVWGDPTDTFCRVGDREGRFIVVPVGRSWFPTDRPATALPITATVSGGCGAEYEHPMLPYRVNSLVS